MLDAVEESVTLRLLTRKLEACAGMHDLYVQVRQRVERRRHSTVSKDVGESYYYIQTLRKISDRMGSLRDP